MRLEDIIDKLKKREHLVLRTKNDFLQINAKYNSLNQIIGYEIIIRTTYRCNLNCRFCFVSDNFEVKEKWTDSFINELRKIDLRGSCVVLSGGEPTLHPKYFDMLEKLKETGASVITQTNGILFSRDFFFNKLEMEDHSFFVSFPSPIEEEYNYITNSSLYKDFFIGVRKLSQRYNVSLNYVLYKENYESFEKALSLVYNHFNFKNIRLVISNLGMLSKFDHINKLAKYSDIIECIREPISLYNDYINIRFTVTGGCSFPLCILNKIISVENETFFKAIKENIGFDNFEKQFFKSKKCFNCNYNDYCQGFPSEYIKMFGKNEIKPF